MINDNDKMKIWTGNNIGDEGARMISESLKTNSTLTELYLYGDVKWSRVKNIISENGNTEERWKW